MKIAYLIDKDSVGGGMGYIRRQIAAHQDDECRVFFSDRGECTAAKMNTWGADVVHVNHLKALVQLFRNPFVKPRGKVVFTVHGIHLRKYGFLPKTLSNRVKRYLRLLLEKTLYRQCDRIIALTPTDAADIGKLYGEGLPVAIEPNAIDPSEIKNPEGDLKYGKGEFAFVSIARFDFQKGQDILLRAIGIASEKLRASAMRTLFVGAGPTFGAMKRLAESLGVSDLVEFAGEIPDAGAYMACARTLVAPSRWEGLPYLLLEAEIRQQPVIASDCPGNRDVAEHCPWCRLFRTDDPADLARLMAP
ncbi:MAG: glycosyltransferase [Kiritimatiellae bacterium]|nr:glycosyltransferase [Kiritimatiellia bacterium]